MTLIKSISGIRGTIGGVPGEGLSPLDVVKFTAAYCTWAKNNQTGKGKLRIVVGRDARISGKMVDSLVSGTLLGMGADVINIGLATTPTTELAVTAENADGGIILTASHNPKQWNALKLLNNKGEFLDDAAGKTVLSIAEKEDFYFAEVDDLGVETVKDYTKHHVQHVLDLDLVDVEAIRAAKFKVAVDAVNSVGGVAVPAMLKALGVIDVVEINCEPHGHFAHTPEPIPENLQETSAIILEKGVDIGFVVDPDVDRLAIINEDGSMFNEEYTLVAVADYVLSQTPGNTVSNLSSSRALRDITEKHNGKYAPSAVGEVNVTTLMKETGAVIGGEGNGGVIYPASHYGRDALVGIGLFLTHLAKSGKKCSELRAEYPNYFISKNKIELTPDIDVDAVLVAMKEKYQHEQVTDVDGVKIDFADEWVHLRKSNTEPIIRVYSEGKSMEKAEALAEKIMGEIKAIVAN
ncbi:phosphoglucosamine mutase [Prolixibacter denitrificans]|uniref:Phosphoglucomutase n=1 Tax=Prolixibacter denitrificans TaxID=1541063 RepID=A0A2P8CKM8_9BACT|nr:phosphoglucosamine mutase [Prolixibacter denitrificans]PSK85511.1 phosphomannomutase [Prolixibacter denitrificans]GET20133.1 phosphoglucomutase [Prolixibacter denitrificans]